MACGHLATWLTPAGRVGNATSTRTTTGLPVLALTTYEAAEPTAAPLLIAHGLYGSGRNWGVIARRLSDSRQVVTVDMRNHGDSPWTSTHTYADMASDLIEAVDTLGEPVDLMGHSMGGKAAMIAALTAPQHIRKLVVADIAPVAYDHSQMKYLAAMRDLDLTAVATRTEADHMLAEHVEDKATRAFLLQSLDVKDRRWRLNLDTLARDMDGIMGFPDVSGTFRGPTLFLAGGASDYVQNGDRARIRDLFPSARLVRIPGAGHWLHAEKPREFEAAIRAFLDA